MQSFSQKFLLNADHLGHLALSMVSPKAAVQSFGDKTLEKLAPLQSEG